MAPPVLILLLSILLSLSLLANATGNNFRPVNKQENNFSMGGERIEHKPEHNSFWGGAERIKTLRFGSRGGCHHHDGGGKLKFSNFPELPRRDRLRRQFPRSFFFFPSYADANLHGNQDDEAPSFSSSFRIIPAEFLPQIRHQEPESESRDVGILFRIKFSRHFDGYAGIIERNQTHFIISLNFSGEQKLEMNIRVKMTMPTDGHFATQIPSHRVAELPLSPPPETALNYVLCVA